MSETLTDVIRGEVLSWMEPVFDYMEIDPVKEEIIFDSATFNGQVLEATFYFKNIKKFKKDLFDEVSDFVFMNSNKPVICEIKKRFIKENQRVYLKVGNDS